MRLTARAIQRRVRGVALGVLAIATLAGCAPATGTQEAPVSPNTPPDAEQPPGVQPEGGPPPSAPSEPGAPTPPSEPSRAPAVGGIVQGGRASTFELPARAGEAARALRVEVDDIENPQSQNLVLVVTALLPSAPLELGRLSFYPVNRGGTFVLPLPPPAAAQVEASRGLTVRCALELDSEAELDAVRARVRSLSLIPAP